jgi:hypothetical protein
MPLLFTDDIKYSDVSVVRKHLRGFIALRSDFEIVEAGQGSDMFGITLRVGKAAVTLSARDRKMQELWVASLRESLDFVRDLSTRVAKIKVEEKEGFIMRGKVKVWAVVRDGTFFVYERQAQTKASENISLVGCTCAEMRDDKGLMLFTPNPSFEGLECLGRKGDETRNERFEWYQAFLYNISKVTPKPGAAAASRPDSTMSNAASAGLTQSKVVALGGAAEASKTATAAKNSVSKRKSVRMLRRATLKDVKAFEQQRRTGNAVCFSSLKKSTFFFSLKRTELCWYKSETEPIMKVRIVLSTSSCHTAN